MAEQNPVADTGQSLSVTLPHFAQMRPFCFGIDPPHWGPLFVGVSRGSLAQRGAAEFRTARGGGARILGHASGVWLLFDAKGVNRYHRPMLLRPSRCSNPLPADGELGTSAEQWLMKWKYGAINREGCEPLLNGQSSGQGQHSIGAQRDESSGRNSRGRVAA
jgi:hypothetical protein